MVQIPGTGILTTITMAIRTPNIVPRRKPIMVSKQVIQYVKKHSLGIQILVRTDDPGWLACNERINNPHAGRISQSANRPPKTGSE
jgi:hypothetical protein